MPAKLLTVLVVCCGLSAVAHGQTRAPANPHPSHAERRPPQGGTASLENWADRLADELDHLQEDLHYDRGEYPAGLLRDADQALQAVIHFQEVLRRETDAEHLRRDFQDMDREVHRLVDRLNQSNHSRLGRLADRIEYADEQLHYLVRSELRGGPDESQEVLARQAHVLASEARRLEQLVRRMTPRGGREDSLARALDEFVEQAEHFHEVAEKGGDRGHLRNDFRAVDEAWRRVVREVNASPYGLYLRRVAQRTNQVHGQIASLLGRESGRDHRDRHQHRSHAEQPQIEFQIPGLGRFQLR